MIIKDESESFSSGFINLPKLINSIQFFSNTPIFEMCTNSSFCGFYCVLKTKCKKYSVRI